MGLDATITHPVGEGGSIEYVLGGVVDLGVTHLPQVMIESARGKPIVAIGSLISRPIALIWLKDSGIHRVADLKGRTIAVPGLSFQAGMLREVLAASGLTLKDVRVVRAEDELVRALVSGEADAIFGGSANLEEEVLRVRGLSPIVAPTPAADVPPDDELVVTARADWVAKHPALARGFMTAVAKGAASAAGDPDAAARLLGESFETNPELGSDATRAASRATGPLLSQDGVIRPVRARTLADWMRRKGLLAKRVPTAAFLDNVLSRAPPPIPEGNK
jgi:ABC-type nitrate/sulfonate/bicarbonate transport system substrate-binding protein